MHDINVKVEFGELIQPHGGQYRHNSSVALENKKIPIFRDNMNIIMLITCTTKWKEHRNFLWQRG